MKIKVYRMIILTLVCSFQCCLSVFAADRGNFSITPKKNNGAKWRIGYYQGGPYVDYQTILKSVIRGLNGLGWVEKPNFPRIDDPADTKQLWLWMGKNLKSEYLQFVTDAYYDADWKDELRRKNKEKVIQRLKKQKDIDFMLAFGTWAGQDLANNGHSTPIEVISASDPLASKIVKGVEDSGYDHVHAKIDLTRYERQVQLFHDVMGFNKLGVVYEDSMEGRSYAAVDKIERVAKERGFEIVRCLAKFSGISEKAAENNVLACYERLVTKVDALYITVHRGVNMKSLPKLLKLSIDAKIPTFSQSGSEEVKRGVLLSVAQAEFKYAGIFHAKSVAKVLNGAKSRDLDQRFQPPRKIAINLATAQLIEYDPPVDILGAADEIYQKIETSK